MAEDSGRLPGEVRTYVIRNTNMSPQRREAYRRLAPWYCIPYAPQQSDVRAAFARPEAPLIMEIGFGMGYTTVELAEQNPNINYLGIEVHKPGVARVLRQLEKRGLDNVRIVHHDAVEVIRDMMPTEICAGCHIFFPDPWPKKRHHKRRLVQPAFPAFLSRVLERDAYVYLVTDWRDYAEQILSAFDESQEFVNRYEGFAPPQAWRPQTPFEKKGREKDHEIFELYFIRKTEHPCRARSAIVG
ncbi:MAG: tRNA (guanosine(46)-N7)-methyltransferase TrmB [Spirochaetota bacterium]